MPALTILLAVGTLGLLARRYRQMKAPTEEPVVAPESDDEWDERLDDELALMD